jgi:hypothetical protein
MFEMLKRVTVNILERIEFVVPLRDFRQRRSVEGFSRAA